MPKQVDVMDRKEEILVAKHVSLKTLAKTLDAHRSSVRRWLNEAGILPIALGNGPKSAIRYPLTEVQAWIAARDRVR
jgi:hypothetical protein